MTVYVDDMRAKYRRMVMCHMVADTEDELHAMAQFLGVSRHWYQGDHYDICRSKRDLAVKAGAVEITQRQLGCMVIRRRISGSLGTPEQAVEWYRSTWVVFPRRHGKTAITKLFGSEVETP